ncbi:MAG: DUF327 family protein [Spirochaetaceae bacterium]|jgi:uncharacterized protein YaaR (DUF327 family)|nr:DUF327 family protein [Spirochaetaceae bacterium]
MIIVKIDFPDGAFFANPASFNALRAETKKARDGGRAKSPARKDFSRLLAGAAASEAPVELPPGEAALNELLDAVHSTGDELKNHPLPDNIKRYKQAVRNFLHYVVENGYTVEEQTSRAGLLKRKKYTLVQVADRKLEELAVAILAGQAGQLDILARVEEINGLLVNMLQ